MRNYIFIKNYVTSEEVVSISFYQQLSIARFQSVYANTLCLVITKCPVGGPKHSICDVMTVNARARAVVLNWVRSSFHVQPQADYDHDYCSPLN